MKINNDNMNGERKADEMQKSKQNSQRAAKTVDRHLHQITNLHDHTHNLSNQKEMQELLAKLKEMIPNMPRNKKLSKLEIIQNVIDYIFDLETALEVHSRKFSTAAAVAAATTTTTTTTTHEYSCSMNG